MATLGIILNEAAGGGRCGRLAPPVLAELALAHDLTVRRTRGPGHGVTLARELADTVDVVVSVGGDGTLFEVVNGLMAVDGRRPALALLPLGTGNSFGRDVGVVDVPSARAALSRATPRPVDVVRVTHADGVVHYVNLLSVGFAAEVGDLTNRRFKRLGALGYIAAVLVQVTRLAPRPFPFAPGADATDTAPLTLLSLSNSRYTGGDMMMAPEARIDDGCVDVVRIGAMGRRRLLSCFPKLFRGTHLQMQEVSSRHVGAVRFEPGPSVPVMLDGEIEMLSLREVEVLPGALEMWA
mgnify:CR=1 FL=1